MQAKGHNGIDDTKFKASFQILAKQKKEQNEKKIQKNVQKQKHILKLQQELAERLRLKNEQIVRKLNKYIEVKKNTMQKIKQKCHQRIQYQSQKTKAHYKKQKIDINKSWKQSRKLSQWINNKTLNESKKQIEPIKQKYQSDSGDQQKQKQIKRIEKHHSVNIGDKLSRDLSQRKPKSLMIINKLNKNSLDLKRHERANSQRDSKLQKQLSNSLNYVEKMKQYQATMEKQKIHSFNKKLQKVQEARMKKQKLQMDRQKKIHDLMQFKKQKLEQAAKNSKRNKVETRRLNTQGNIKSQSNFSLGQSKSDMFKKWEQQNKLRQQQLFQKRLYKGNIYLQEMKDKTDKNKISKSILDDSIQKRLFLQRKKLNQLHKSPGSSQRSGSRVRSTNNSGQNSPRSRSGL